MRKDRPLKRTLRRKVLICEVELCGVGCIKEE
jgi:hypothetical protein